MSCFNVYIILLFFFSSRRRHTRCLSDWSSDVCSSDLSMHARHTVTAVVTGKPIDLGGSSGRREATGRGILFVINEAIKRFGMLPETTRVIVQGSGNVGEIGALLLHEAGYNVVAISDVHRG